MVLLCTAAVVLGGNLQKRPGRRQVLVEKGVTMLYDMVESTMASTTAIGRLYRRAVPQLDLRFFYRHDRYFPLIYR